MEDDNKVCEESGDLRVMVLDLVEKVDLLVVDNALIKNLLKTQCALLEKAPNKPQRVRKARVKPPHPHTRCPIHKPWLAELEVEKDTRFYRNLAKYNGNVAFQREKFVGRTVNGTIHEFEKMRRERVQPHPTYFDSYFKTLLATPHNCCFFIQCERPYVCGSEEDQWHRVLKRNQFWDMLRIFLWETYRRYTDKCIGDILTEEPEKSDVLNDLSDAISHRNPDDIPLTRQYMLSLVMCGLSYGSLPSNICRLESAYSTRKK